MAITYTQTDTAADCGAMQACATNSSIASPNVQSQLVEGGTAGTTEQTADIPSGSSVLASFFQTTGGVGEQTWPAGTYTIRWNVTTSQNNTSITGVWVCAVDSSCGSVGSHASDTSLSLDISGGGVFSTTVTAGSDLSVSETDDLYIITEITNSHNMTSRSVGITPDQNIDTPIVKSQTANATAASASATAPAAGIPGVATFQTTGDWDNRASETGMAHEDVANTDHTDASVLKHGYAYSSYYNAANLTALWPLHEDSGTTAYDVSGNGYHGDHTMYHGAPQVGQPGVLSNTCYYYDGVDDGVDVGTGPSPGSGSFSVHAWIKPDTASFSGNTGAIVMNRETTDGQWLFNAINDGSVRFRLYDGGWVFDAQTATGLIDDGNWHHVMGSFDGPNNTGYIYIDGVQEASHSSGSGGPVDTHVSLGYDARADSRWYAGYSAEVAIWNIHQTESDAAAIYDIATAQSSLHTSEKVI